MRKLQLVKGSAKDDQTRQSRGRPTSGERRYRYPAEEIWEVSEEQWDVRDMPHRDEKVIAAH
jgi:hypothetical protein